MRTPGSKLREELRLAIEALPRQAREAMLRGIESGPIIAGAYSSGDGVCPMLAAHRYGGRSNVVGFAQAWDHFAFGRSGRVRPRQATERELLILKVYLQASLLAGPAVCGERAVAAPEPARAASAASVAAPQAAAGREDLDRRAELAARPGWSWTAPVRRYDDFQRLLAGLETTSPVAEPVLS